MWMPLPGNTFAEAMADGLPAMSFDCDTGPRGMICHDVDGLPIPLGDVAGLMSPDRLTGMLLSRCSLLHGRKRHGNGFQSRVCVAEGKVLCRANQKSWLNLVLVEPIGLSTTSFVVGTLTYAPGISSGWILTTSIEA